jgi:hypothetical protein
MKRDELLVRALRDRGGRGEGHVQAIRERDERRSERALWGMGLLLVIGDCGRDCGGVTPRLVLRRGAASG